jgi:putative transposase
MEKELFDRLISQYERPEEAAVAGGLVERILGAEMNHYLRYEKGQAPKLEAGQERQNHRNGTSKKTLISEEGNLEIEVPRDRTGDFEPQFIAKGQRRFGGFDNKIIAMYAQGMTVRSDQTLPGRTVQSGDFFRSGQHGDRFGPGGRARVAEPAAGECLCGRVL